MGLVSVNIPEMAALVKALEDAPETITSAHSRITAALTSFGLSTSNLSSVPEVAVWAEDEAGILRSQLGYARWLDASTPGIQTTVTFDAAAVPELSEDRAKELADEAESLMDEVPPPERLLTLLERYGSNPQFALFLMGGYRAGEGSASMDAGPYPNLEYLAKLSGSLEQRGSPEFNSRIEKFLQLYSTTLGSLSYEFDLPDSLTEHPLLTADGARAWALLASRGDWNPDWVAGLTEKMIELERSDPDFWTKTKHGGSGHYTTIKSFWDPTMQVWVEDPMVWMMDALSRNPEAALRVFEGGGDAPIKVDGDKVDIPANLRYLTLERGWPQDQALSMMLALGAANSGGDGLQHHLDLLKDMDEVEKKSWYSFAAHLGLDVIGFVPVLGEWADGVNVGLSLAEGDWAGAAASGAAAVPVFGSTATIAKWIHRVNQAGQAGSAALTAQNLKDLLDEVGLTDQEPGTPPRVLPDEAVFLTDRPGHHWPDHLGEPDGAHTYVVNTGYSFRTNKNGKVVEEWGDQSALSPAERMWLQEHR